MNLSRWTVLRRTWFVLLALLLPALVLPAIAAMPKSASSEQVERWLAQLGSRKYAERQAAARALEELGPAGLPALLQATKNADVEVRRQANRLVQVIHKRQECDRLLEPSRVRLDYHDRAVAEIVADLAKKTGLPLAIDPNQAEIGLRKITLDSGETTFWQAFDQLCRKAELTEHGLVLVQKKDAKWNYAIASKEAADKPRLVLVSGKPPILATCYAGGMRIRVLPPTIPLEGLTPGEGESILVLEAALEAKLGRRMHKIIGARLDRPMAEGGTQPDITAQMPEQNQNIYVTDHLKGEGPLNYATRLGQGMNAGNLRRILLRIKGGGKKLHELRGILFAEIQQADQAVITIPEILKAEGKNISTYDGTTLGVTKVEKDANGNYVIHFNSTVPLGNGISGIQMNNGGIRVRRMGSNEWESIGVDPTRLKLLDPKGRPIPKTGHVSNGTNFQVGSLSQRLTVYFRPAKGQKPPAKLIFFGVRTSVVDVPFTLKDIPLK